MLLIRNLVLTCVAALMPLTATAQETPKSSSGLAGVHQFGIIRAGTLMQSDPLPVPSFVHQAKTSSSTNTALLDYSALYFLPPYMMKQHLELTVSASISDGAVSAWYPYAHETTNSAQRVWRDMQIGVMADGLETDHPQWMMPRAMELASTVKVYKPGPVGSKPDDIGTTEGEVYVFLRGTTDANFLRATRDAETIRASIPETLLSKSPQPLTDTNPHAWLAEATTTGIVSRSVMLRPGAPDRIALSTTAHIDDGSTEVQHTEQDLLTRLNEAITGYGLRPDEAMAQARLVIESLNLARRPVLIYFLNRDWIEKHFPLSISGPAEPPQRVFIVLNGI